MIINNIIFNGYENNNIHDIKNGYYFGICLLETKQNRVKSFAHRKIDELKHSWLICYSAYSKARIIIKKNVIITELNCLVH